MRPPTVHVCVSLTPQLLLLSHAEHRLSTAAESSTARARPRPAPTLTPHSKCPLPAEDVVGDAGGQVGAAGPSSPEQPPYSRQCRSVAAGERVGLQACRRWRAALALAARAAAQAVPRGQGGIAHCPTLGLQPTQSSAGRLPSDRANSAPLGLLSPHLQPPPWDVRCWGAQCWLPLPGPGTQYQLQPQDCFLGLKTVGNQCAGKKPAANFTSLPKSKAAATMGSSPACTV